jgi:hypothetical protein
MIVVGGAMAVIANTLYPLARSNEATLRLASDAKSILLPEVKHNLEIASAMQRSLSNGNVILYKFDVTAWETISKGGLLIGLKPTEITLFLSAYRLAYQANDFHAQFLDASSGIRSTLTNAPELRQLYQTYLLNTLSPLSKALSALDQQP